MAKLEELYRDYYQKSRLFLYPILGIKRGASVTPKDTYMSWFREYGIDKNKFICTYHMRDDREFKIFEDVKLLGNPLFHKFFELEEGNLGAYVFDMSYNDDFQAILCGKYSQLSKHHKETILEFCKVSLSNFTYMESFLYPERYWHQYVRLLTVEKKDKSQGRKDRADMLALLKDVGELYSKPDLEKETLFSRKKVLDFQTNDISLSDETNNLL